MNKKIRFLTIKIVSYRDYKRRAKGVIKITKNGTYFVSFYIDTIRFKVIGKLPLIVLVDSKKYARFRVEALTINPFILNEARS